MASSVNHTPSSSNVNATAENPALGLFSLSFELSEFLRLLTAKEFPEKDAMKWVDGRWNLVIQVCTLYVLTIFGIRWAMRNRQPFNLQVPLNAWNLFLAVFSIMGSLKLTPEFFSVLYNQGFQASYCKAFDYTEGLNGYWVWLFITSKMFELVDTIFIVLRKRPLLFLHWYHHILTMIYAFYSYPITPGFNRWGIYLNFVVHAFMYSYYFLRSMKVRVPGTIAKFVTSIQIWQFIISVGILIHLGYIVYAKNVVCDLDDRVFAVASFMDLTYLVLFINFFLKSYVLSGGKAKYQSSKVKSAGDENGKLLSNGHHHGSNGTAVTSNGINADLRKRNFE
jgi:elongation of very long chain fatty acids protein 6